MKLLKSGLPVAALTIASLAPLQAALAQPVPPREVSREQARAGAEKLFAAMDLNHDGKLDAADRELRIGRMFERIDADRDGTISRAEFLAAHRDGAERHEHEPGPAGMMRARALGMGAEILREADPQRTGTVSREGFIAAALALFDRADANRDGRITPEERRAALAGRMGRPGPGRNAIGGPAMGGMDMHGDDMMPPSGE